jgi:hypothetical protein
MLKPEGRFVLLHHILSDSDHWDLMLDCGLKLATWQISVNPIGADRPASTATLPARRIGDHRRAYLDYEGPVSGSRGEVRRVDQGFYRRVEERVDTWVVELDGAQLTGRFELPATLSNPS